MGDVRFFSKPFGVKPFKVFGALHNYIYCMLGCMELTISCFASAPVSRQGEPLHLTCSEVLMNGTDNLNYSKFAVKIFTGFLHMNLNLPVTKYLSNLRLIAI